MKTLCTQLGGSIAVSMKTEIANLPKVGTRNCDTFWIGIVKGGKLSNGSYSWLDKNQKPVNTALISWARNEPNGEESERCAAYNPPGGVAVDISCEASL